MLSEKEYETKEKRLLSLAEEGDEAIEYFLGSLGFRDKKVLLDDFTVLFLRRSLA